MARLNEDNAIVGELILPLLDREQSMVDAMRARIRRDFGALCHQLVFVDIMTGRGRIDVIADESRHEEIRRKADACVAGIDERYGIPLEFRIFSWKDAPMELL